MNRQQARAQDKKARLLNKRRPKTLTEVKKSDWPHEHSENLKKVFVSRYFLVQEYHETGSIRLSINRTLQENGDWCEKITWEELQEVKRQIGYGDTLAVEIYPEDANIVNVANMRHLWIFENLNIGWKK